MKKDTSLRTCIKRGKEIVKQALKSHDKVIVEVLKKHQKSEEENG